MIRDEETLNLLLDSIRRFVREVLVPQEDVVAETDQIPPAVVAQMRELGLFGLSIPEAYGGLALTMEEEVRVAFEIARTSPAFRSLIGTNNGIGSQGIVIDGTEEQKQRLPAAPGIRRNHRLVRADRTGLRLGRSLAAHDGGARRRLLCAERQQALHHQCAGSQHLHRDGAHRPCRAKAPARSPPSSSSGHARPVIGKIDKKMGQRARIPATSSSRTAACRPRT
jgi:acyl-CoA dehydrogenase